MSHNSVLKRAQSADGDFFANCSSFADKKKRHTSRVTLFDVF